ncbi:hypothetical protein EIP86_009326 [Pleurotus ostreatoroseus]|nr:hypothetical protein EIP86_009326 [Pleurotus ostreatoroseus]
MARIQDPLAIWSLFHTEKSEELQGLPAEAFTKTYETFEADPAISRITNFAHDIWILMLRLQIQCRYVTLVFRDNHFKAGGILPISASPSAATLQPAGDTVSFYNNASLLLPSFCRNGTFEYPELYEATDYLVHVLDDVTASAVEETRWAIGVHGLADVFIEMSLPFDDAQARQVSVDISATVYFSAMSANTELGRPPNTEPSLPFLICMGILPRDMIQEPGPQCSLPYDWDALSASITKRGLRYPQLIAYPPAASLNKTDTLAGCCDPHPSCVPSF